MKTISIALILCFAHVSAESIMDPAEIDLKIEETLLPSRGGHGSDISWINDENRQLVIEGLQQKANDPDAAPYVKTALVRAGHWETILGLIDDLKDPGKETESLMYANEEIIPYLMPLVYTGSTIASNLPGSDVIRNSPRANAVGTLLGKIRKCEGFPQKTRKWAEEMSNNNRAFGYLDEAWVSLLTSWWEHNQEAILEKRYKDAKWLPTYKGVPINRTPEEARQIVDYLEQENAKRLAKRAGPADAPGDTVRRRGAGPGEATAEKSEETPTKLFWICVVAVVAAAGYYVRSKLTAKPA